MKTELKKMLTRDVALSILSMEVPEIGTDDQLLLIGAMFDDDVSIASDDEIIKSFSSDPSGLPLYAMIDRSYAITSGFKLMTACEHGDEFDWQEFNNAMILQ